MRKMRFQSNRHGAKMSPSPEKQLEAGYIFYWILEEGLGLKELNFLRIDRKTKQQMFESSMRTQ